MYVDVFMLFSFFFFKQKTAYEMRISDWSSDVCSSDLYGLRSGSAFGHLGFLTVLCWADPSRDISVALLNTGKSFAPAMYTRLISIFGAIDSACTSVA